MLATLRRLLLVSAGAIALSASGLAQVNTDISNVMAQAKAAHERDDYAEAIRWYRVAADQGSAAAQFNLGVLYENGQGVTQNYIEAVGYYRLAAVQGLAQAQFNLGSMYSEGLGVARDYAEAVRWYRLAADQGFASARYNLGNQYRSGQGEPLR